MKCMKYMKYIILGFLLMYQTASYALAIDNIVVFGDSLSDTGNLYQYMNYQLPMSPPYYKGRFSDGPLWVELVTEYLSKYNPHIQMENYAFGGALVLQKDDFFPGAYLSLRSQVDAYLEEHPTQDNKHTLYTILMGGNDYIGLDEDQSITEHIERVTSEISHQASRLAEHGAQFILIGNLPELGKTPFARELNSEKILSEISVEHNISIKQQAELLKNNYPKTNWIFFDVYSFFTDAFDHPEKYGIENTYTPCYSLDDDIPQAQPIIAFASNSQLLNIKPHNCDSYLFFDIVHPTRRGHAFTASLALTSIEKAITTAARHGRLKAEACSPREPESF